jgi:GNAT superfamily N-acetyltransferase
MLSVLLHIVHLRVKQFRTFLCPDWQTCRIRAGWLAWGVDIKIKRLARPEIPLLLELIRELARFENLEPEVEATVESLQDSFFGTPPAAGALLARAEGELAGYAVYFFTFSSFIGRPGIWLEDVYVREKFRHKGIGHKLIHRVARIGAERNCGRFEWIALNWNTTALQFYRNLGARSLDEWTLLRLDSQGLQKLALLDHSPKRGTSRRARTPLR